MSDYLPLGECCNHILDFRGRTPLKLGMDWGGGNIPALSANNVKDGYIDFQKECNVGSDDLYRAWMTRGDCRKGDILFTMEAPMGNVAQVPDNGKYILSQRVILISPKSKVVCGNYLFHFLRSDEFRKQCDYLATGTTAKGIKQANLVGIEIPIPPLPEQKKIAEILSGIDRLISLLEISANTSPSNTASSKVSKLRLLKKAVASDLLSGRKRVSELQVLEGVGI